MRHWILLKTLLSHWRRRPFQLLTLMVGLAIATALWSGVQALNVQARESYDRAAAIVGGEARPGLRARTGGAFDQALHVALRRAGWPVSPVMEGDLELAGRTYRLIGIDPVTMPADEAVVEDGSGEADGEDRLLALLTPPSLLVGNGETVEALGGEGSRPTLPDGGLAPPLAVDPDLPPGTLMTDVGVAQRLLRRPGELTRLVLGEIERDDLPSIESVTQGRLERVEPERTNDLDRLTDSFHLNLTAFGFLAFLVGLFIVHASIGLAFEQRRPMLRTVRACGISARALMMVMVAELVLLSALAGLVGVAAGYVIASALLPDVAASLRGLYGARVAGELSLEPGWWAAGIAISVLGALLAAGSSLLKAWRLPLFATAQPQAWAVAQRRTMLLQMLAATALAFVGTALYLFGAGLIAGFALMGCILLAAALALPAALGAVIGFFRTRTGDPVGQWFFADARQQLSGLSLALMALLLALAVNVGVGTMVDSFRLTFTGWLDQRLAAELYVGARDEAEARDVSAWLAARPEVSAVLPVWNAETRYRDWPVEVYGFRDHRTYSENWPLIDAGEEPWTAVRAGGAILVSEQLARRFDISIGDEIAIPTPAGDWPVQVAAIYSDYGNPRGQIMIPVEELIARFPDAERDRFAVRVDPDATAGLAQAVRQRFGLGSDEVVDQSALKAFSQRIFERTFAVTLALNTLTLIVAGVALAASLLTLATMRLPQLAPLWAMGLTRRRLATLELLRTLALALLTALLALPLGLLVAWVLMTVINVEAFGWRLPLFLFPGKWVQLLLMALATALVAGAWPALRLRHMPPTALLKVFADER